MALTQVAEFVGEHASVFAFGLGVDEQTAIHADHPAGGGEGVDLLVADQDEGQAVILQVAGLGQSIDAGFDEVLDLRVADRIDLVAQHAQPGASELKLLLWRNDG
ncbi:hypothetical protein D3C76_1397210 [compost metagenome]